ncbi:MAG: hypothetical protein IJX66_01665 [Lachnospiraceae bacterium]|nr:hypothetical protein [Lachnospiraceae bacterium]
MNFKRLFTTEGVKGKKDYLDSQKKYEIIRTVIFFGISIALFVAGFVTTGDRNNLLTIVAILGCLPASKSMVGAIMYCRQSSLAKEDADKIEAHTKDLTCLYDMVFTTREKIYPVLHIAVCGNTIAGYMPVKKTSENPKKALSENACAEHLNTCLKVDNYKDVTIKIFTDLDKYTTRLSQLQELETEDKHTEGICNTLKSIAL